MLNVINKLQVLSKRGKSNKKLWETSSSSQKTQKKNIFFFLFYEDENFWESELYLEISF